MNMSQLLHSVPAAISVDQKEWHLTSSQGVPWSIYQGHVVDVLKQLPDETFNCCVTSPPYYSLRDYAIENQIGLEETVTEYVQAISQTMAELFKKLKSDGLLFLNLGDTYYSGKGMSHGIDRKSNKRRFGLRPVDKSGGVGIGIQRKSMIAVPWRVAIEMSKGDWVLRSTIIWHREKALPEAVKDRPRRSYEYVFMFAKDRHYYFNRQPLIDKNIDEDVWTIAPRPKIPAGIETAPYPDELVQRCLDIGCPVGGSVIDPFAGSGTTLRVAIQSGRPATGIDIHPAFCSYMVNELRRL